MKYIGLALMLALANFLYQYLTGQRWDVAMERTYFQAIALAIAWWMP